MRHGADDRDAVALAGQHIGGAGKARDIARARRIEPGLGAVRGAQAEIGKNLSGRRQHHARRLRGNQRLEMQDVDQPRLHQLRLRQRRGDADERLARKADGAFRNGVHVAGETKTAEIIEQVLPEAAGRFQPIDLRWRETQVFQIVERVRQAGGEQEGAPAGQPPHEEFEHRLLVLAAVQIGLDHVELVEIGGERAFDGGHGGLLGRGHSPPQPRKVKPAKKLSGSPPYVAAACRAISSMPLPKPARGRQSARSRGWPPDSRDKARKFLSRPRQFPPASFRWLQPAAGARWAPSSPAG